MARSAVSTRGEAPPDDGAVAGGGPGALRQFAAIVLGIHGLAHSTGFVLLWDLAEPANLTYAEAVPEPGSFAGQLAGVGWLLAGALFVVAAVLLYGARHRARLPLAAAIVTSIAVLLPSRDGTSLGITVDLLIIVVAFKVFARGRTTMTTEPTSSTPDR